MKLSTRSRYGTRLLLEMAVHYKEGPIQLAEIARRQEVSTKYLEQIIIPLKKAGYVHSMRGPKGGHMLARSPETIRLGEVVALLEGGLGVTECADHPESCRRASFCMTRFLWKEISEAIRDRLDSFTLLDLIQMGPEDRNGVFQCISGPR